MSEDVNKMFSGNYYVVTGGTQGLGAAVAQLLAERGAAGLMLCGRNRQAGAAQVDKLRALGCNAHFIAADIADPAACRKVIAEAERSFGTLHGLVNCAGMSDRGTILDTTPELFDAIFAVNIRAPFFLMQEAIKVMIKHRVAGAIVNIVTITAHGGQSFLAPYAASKGALITLTKNVAFSAMRNRIRVNGLNIGWMDTPHENEIQRQYHDANDDWLAQAEREQPFGRLLKPREVARAVAFMLSEESGMMTGAVVDFDQGVIGCGDGGSPKPERPLSL
ncbi:SDR family oxidoreductase [Serratia ficaria]|uniref:3-oxoacyl-[acyl-carrier-protein] reductase FabG n=1 Tax=Serratia ficaria TaxID=61651 RepID=A0A240C2F8_SERFI|nr:MULTISPECIES: SDR family oxidoreductase [Serratia]MEE4484314.1 SDR family oxidoreductase [Serratia ficaria]REF44812.1 NAD(P)-dependent dehydrogenase (short-subunit alcohol dehydrogenase family) [Serratia ficaria]CAI0826592.1 3-oxoacyl-[acyl-carrier-protein] reductase FabG [Serratia ficaria]CAI0878030.1 3-oxoacyl-[acyl-carrier-protein] reductase FabG [Serratia ficaria]CAI0892098.1 3-oxoacyl-[acyl-carrier-protein] reductase FabG [Serratia ficaria]